MKTPPLSLNFLARVTIGQWLAALFALALVSWGQAFHHNISQIGLLGAGLFLYWAARGAGPGVRRAWLAFGGAGVALLVLGLALFSGERLPTGHLNPNGLASVLLLVLPTYGTGWVIFLVGLGLLATQSRAALIAIAPFFYQVAQRVFVSRWVSVAFVAMMVVWLGVAVWARPGTVQSRLDVWQEAIGLANKNPVWGVGWGNYAHYARVERAKTHADSLPLTFVAEMGWVGGLAGLAVVGGLGWRVWRTPTARDGVRLGLLIFLVQQAVDNTPTHVIPLAFLMLSLADVEP